MTSASSLNSCLIHFDGESKNFPLTTFSEVSFDKFLECRSIWLTLDGIQRKVAKNSLQFVSEDVESNMNYAEYENFSYHRGCYSRFTNATDIKRAKTRCQKKCNEGECSSTCTDVQDTLELEDPQPAKKILRSSIPTCNPIRPRNPHVLPQVCIICQSEKSYFTESVSWFYYN